MSSICFAVVLLCLPPEGDGVPGDSRRPPDTQPPHATRFCDCGEANAEPCAHLVVWSTGGWDTAYTDYSPICESYKQDCTLKCGQDVMCKYPDGGEYSRTLKEDHKLRKLMSGEAGLWVDWAGTEMEGYEEGWWEETIGAERSGKGTCASENYCVAVALVTPGVVVTRGEDSVSSSSNGDGAGAGGAAAQTTGLMGEDLMTLIFDGKPSTELVAEGLTQPNSVEPVEPVEPVGGDCGEGECFRQALYYYKKWLYAQVFAAQYQRVKRRLPGGTEETFWVRCYGCNLKESTMLHDPNPFFTHIPKNDYEPRRRTAAEVCDLLGWADESDDG